MKTRPWTMLLVMMAGWMNRQQQKVIEYLKQRTIYSRKMIRNIGCKILFGYEQREKGIIEFDI